MTPSSRASGSASRTPTADPNSPANMLPCTNAPRLPNIGLISTSGSSAISDRKNCLSSSLGLGISTVGSRTPLGGLRRLLDDAEHGALRVSDYRHAPDRGVERRDQDRAAELAGLGHGGVRVGHAEVHVP